MTIALRQSTASQEIPLGFLLDSTDGNTEETGLTIANTDIKIWKSGATTLANKNSGGATHISNGVYYAVLDATDTDTVGSLIVFCHPSGALAIRVECQVFEEAVFDALYAASAPGYLQPTTAGRTLDVTATGAAGIDWGNIENKTTSNDLNGTSIDSASSVTVGAIEVGIISASTFAAGAIDAAALATDAVTEIQSGLATAASIAALNNLSAAQVNAEVDTALADIHLDHLLAVDYDPASKPGTATALLNELIGSDAGVSQFTTNALELAPTGGSAPTAAAIADAVWDETLSGHLTAGSTGEALNAAGDPWTTALPGAYGAGSAGKIIGDNINAPIATVDTVVDAIKVKTDYLPSVAAGGAGGVFIAGSNAATAANITGNITGNLSGSVGSVTGAVGSVTGNVGGTVDGLVVAIATIDANVDAILADTAEIGTAGVGLDGIPWNPAWDAEVQSEVQDAIEVNHLDHLLAVDYDPTSKPGTATALLNELIGSDAGVSQFTANALELAPTGGSAPTAAAIADAVWDEAIADHLTAGSTGEALNAAGDPWTTTLPGAYSGSQAGKILADVLVDTGTTLQAELDNIQADTEDIQTRIPAALLSGRMDASVGAYGSAGVTPLLPTVAGRTLDVTATGAAGIDWGNIENKTTSNDLNGTSIDSASSVTVGAIEVGIISASTFAAGAIDAAALATDAVTEIQSGVATAASIAALNNLSAAQVNAEVVDALATDTYAEPGQGAPGATISLAAKMNYLYKAWRNKKTQTATTFTLYADDATTADQKATTADDGTTFSQTEMTTGA